jgi:hypothetical protein
MPLIDKQILLGRLAPPLDKSLTEQVLDEFVSLERRYVLRDWEPAELDGGQFCEILARILYHQDSGNLNPNKKFNECVEYLENDQVPHHIQPRQQALDILQVLSTVYRFRSKRGAVHISATYSANPMDARCMIENVRWCMNETLRIYWQGDKEQAAKAIRELLDFDVPCIGKFENIILVQRTDLKPEEEVLVLLHYAGDQGFSRKELGLYAQCSAPAVTVALQNLCSPKTREVVPMDGKRYRLTDLGTKRVREKLGDKLLLQ